MSLVSVIIPVFNCEVHLVTAIESALNQTWEEKEIIVVDDGSSDASLEVARKFEERGVLVISQENKGASAARNAGLRVAKGEWIQFLDADDFLREDKIKTQLCLLKHDTDLAVCKTVHFINDRINAKPDNDDFFHDYLNDPLRFLIKLYGGFDFCSGMIQPNAFLVSRRIIDKAGKWNESLSLDDDGEFFCRVILASKQIVYSSQAMNFYRKYESNASLSGTKSSTAYRSQFQSNRLKHQHLLSFNKDIDLVPYIHTATFKSMQLLLHALYPKHRSLYSEVEDFTKTLIKHSSRGKEVYGGSLANFIGNHVSWKLLKRLQNLKSSISLPQK
jgi:glycosyltransferase involved in cell wall biosynthesis